MKLYGYWRSSSAYRVRIGLELKRVDYEHGSIHLLRGEQRGTDYGALNPMHQVPVLEVLESGKTVRITQSLAILEYLDERFPDPPLLPRDRLERARCRELAEIINCGIQPLQNLEVLRKLAELAPEVDKNLWLSHFLKRGLNALERHAAEISGRYLVGEEVSLADVLLIPQLYSARRYAIELLPYPTLCRVEQACLELEGFRRAAPEKQPDAEQNR
ncbi:MAG TPA: maleylacetoacetate isomerase [Polyangiaceae bacterium]|jgi:maleylpyruvate isomerase